MKRYRILIADEAIDEIQESIDWYDEQQEGLGERFYKAVSDHIKLIKSMPFFGIRYDQVRCLKIKRFPYLIHYQIDEATNLVMVVGILHTSLDPDKYWKTGK